MRFASRSDDDAITDVVRALPDQSGCRRCVYSLSLEDALNSSWQGMDESRCYDL